MRAIVSSGTTRYSQTQACLRLVACMGDFVQSLKQVAKVKTGPRSALSIMKYITKKVYLMMQHCVKCHMVKE